MSSLTGTLAVRATPEGVVIRNRWPKFKKRLIITGIQVPLSYRRRIRDGERVYYCLKGQPWQHLEFQPPLSPDYWPQSLPVHGLPTLHLADWPIGFRTDGDEELRLRLIWC